MDTLEEARKKYRVRSVRWGFYWAMWCAVLWGAWYIPGTAVWYEKPFVDMGSGGQSEFLLAAAVITALSSLAVLFFLFVWLGVLEKWGEYARTVRQVRISKWFCFGAVFGGPCALFGSYLAIGYVGPVFAAIAALGLITAAIYSLWMMQQTFQGTPDSERQMEDFGYRELTAMAAMMVALIWLGLYPQPVLDLVQPVLDGLYLIVMPAEELVSLSAVEGMQ